MLGLVVVALLAADERDWACEDATRLWEPLQLPAPCVVFKGAKPETRAALLQEAWKLDAAQAACAVAAIDAEGTEHRRLTREPPPSPWLTCVTQYPAVLAFWPPTFGVYAPHSLLAEPVTKLVAMGAEGRQALRTLSTLQQAPIEVVLGAFHAEPSALRTLLSTNTLQDDVKTELAAAAMEERGAQLTKAEWAALTAPLLKGLLRRQEVFLAAEYFQKLPEFERRRFSAAASELGDDYIGNPRVLLAIGLAATGKKDQARAIKLAAFPTPTRREGAVWKEVLAFLLSGKRASSPWEAGLSAVEANLSGPALLVASLPYFADAEVLPVYAVQRALEWRTALRTDFTARFEQRLALARDRALQKLPAKWLPTAAAETTPATLPEALPSPWKERAGKWAGPGNPDAKLNLPARFWAVRTEKQGTRLVALATSQVLDPVGEIGPGGYWLLRSNDNGGTWKETYLGLIDRHPFHANEASSVPLLDAHDVVRLDLEDAPLDEASITFPPIALRADTRRAHVILEAPLAALEEDLDHDGLSNLVEARLLLDPKNKDTDGDGFLDGDDLTPRLDDHLTPTVKAEMLNAFLEDFGSGRDAPPAVVMPTNHDGGFDLGQRRTNSLDDVRFLVGAPGEFNGVKPLSTFITLTNGELTAAEARFGTFYPMDLDVVVVGTDHAYVRWSEGWRGGSARIDRDADGHLVVTSLGEWVT